jgi:hypothetical protein
MINFFQKYDIIDVNHFFSKKTGQYYNGNYPNLNYNYNIIHQQFFDSNGIVYSIHNEDITHPSEGNHYGVLELDDIYEQNILLKM